LELQAQPCGCVGRSWNIQEGGETDGLPRLVDVSCEGGESAVSGYPLPCTMGRRQARSRSIWHERSSGNGKEGRSSMRHERGLVVSCLLDAA
jgi:hypothetical protein